MPTLAVSGENPRQPPAATALPSAFWSDLHLTLAAGQSAVLEEALKRTDRIFKSGASVDLEQFAEEIAKVTGCEERVAEAVLRAVTMLAMGTVGSSEGSTVDLTVEAIQKAVSPEKGGLLEEERAPLRALVTRLVSASAATEQALQAGRAARGVLPMFQELAATLELRSTLLVGGAKNSAATPHLDLIPIASILLKLDSGNPSVICFQATEEDLAKLQERVGELQAGLQELKKRVQVVPS